MLLTPVPTTTLHHTLMALRELPLRTATALCNNSRPAVRAAIPLCRRNASSEAVREIEDASSLEVPPPSQELAKNYDPVARSRLRRRGNKQLPPSRYGR
jgi:large subunit ribosomal protein L5